MTTTQTPSASWRATVDYRDPTAKGGYRRVNLTSKVTREAADAAVMAAVATHVAETGHSTHPAMTFPGKTHVACECLSAFHATGLAR